MTVTDSAAANKNTECLLSAMDTGQIHSDRGQVSQKIQALPTVIANTPGPLCYSSKFALIEVTACDLTPNSLAQFTCLRKYLPDYLKAFAAYTKKHFAQLFWKVEMETYAAHSNCPADYPLSPEALNTWGILNGVQQFVWEFHKDLAPDKEVRDMLHALAPQKPSKLFRNALIKSVDYADSNVAIASQFCAIAARWITDGDLELYSLRREHMNKHKLMTQGVIFRDSEYHYFSRVAFSAVCKATGNTAPMVLKALYDTSVLAGPQTNNSTYQTRKNTAGKSMALYKLDSTAMDEYSKFE